VAKGSNSQEKATQSYWMTIDIPQNKLYVSDMPRPLMVTEFGSPDPNQYEYKHIVQQGESFASIAEQSHGSFTASELASWNNKTLQSVIHPGDVLFLFVNDIILSNLEDSWCSSISIPRVNYNQFGLTYKPITTTIKLSDFAKNNPSLGLIGLNPNPAPIVIIAPPDETIYKQPEKPIIVNPESERPVNIPESEPISQSFISRNGWLVRGSLIAAFVLLPSNAFTVRTEGSPSSDLLDAQLKAEEEIKVELKNRIVPSPEKSPQKGRRGLYVTYTKVQSNVLDHTNTPDGTDISMYTTKTYVGRTRGYNTAKNLVKIRNSNHHKNKIGVGYTKHGCVDMALYITALNPDNPAQRYADISYKFIRGREQNVMDDVGKPWVEMLNKDRTMTRSGNAINGISKLHPWFITWTQLARLYGLLPSVPFTFAPNCTP
jgi:LysM repeat protein